MTRKKVIIAFESMEFCAAFMTETAPSVIHEYKRNPWATVEVDDGELEALNAREDIKVFDDIQFEVCPQEWERDNIIPMESALDQDDVLRHIKAEEAWEKVRGEDVYIAIVDTGICGTMPEFPDWKKADGWAFDGKPWEDYYGHGSMCACIAAATKAEGGRFNGVAPDAKLYSCKTRLSQTPSGCRIRWMTFSVLEQRMRRIISEHIQAEGLGNALTDIQNQTV